MTMVVDLNLCFLSPFLCFAFRGVKYFVPRVLTNQSWNQFLWSTGRKALSKQQVLSNNPRIKWVTPKSPFSFHSPCREVVISSKLPEKQVAKPCLLRPALGHSSFCYLPVTPATNCIFRKQLRKQQFPSPSLLSGMKLSSDISFPLIPPKCKQCFPQQFCVSSWVQQASCRHPSSISPCSVRSYRPCWSSLWLWNASLVALHLCPWQLPQLPKHHLSPSSSSGSQINHRVRESSPTVEGWHSRAEGQTLSNQGCGLGAPTIKMIFVWKHPGEDAARYQMRKHPYLAIFMKILLFKLMRKCRLRPDMSATEFCLEIKPLIKTFFFGFNLPQH